jgi:acyl-CoA reductase-like NAD-dependent aldehyde dehydrogenase
MMAAERHQHETKYSIAWGRSVNQEQSKVDGLIEALKNAPIRSFGLSLQRRMDLCDACLNAVQKARDEWLEVGAQIKQGAGQPSIIAEELLTGPLIAVRLLKLLRHTFSDFLNFGAPQQLLTRGGDPNTAYSDSMPVLNRSHRIPIFPTRFMDDRWLFPGVYAHAVLLPETPYATRHAAFLEMMYAPKVNKICAVLGAGNVSSVPFSDTVHKTLVMGQQVILKMNPVNVALRPVFEKILAPLIEDGLLVIVEGDGKFGSALVNHHGVDEVHLTGSHATYDRIVWGDTLEEQNERKRREEPKLKKTITSELGNITPWIVVPGKYSRRQLRSQAKHIAASITNNVGFNCLATRLIITCSSWSQRQEFLQLIRKAMQETPKRYPYYPGTVERYERFTGMKTELDEQGCLPWCLIDSANPESHPLHFSEESFAPLCAEMTIESHLINEFLQKATEFCNDRLPGSLCASITVPSGGALVLDRYLNTCISQLQYGCVCINQWSGLAYSLLTPGWGGNPLSGRSYGRSGEGQASSVGGTLHEKKVGSGNGFVHNTFLLDRLEKTVLRGPLVDSIKPVWFPEHRYPLELATALFNYYAQDGLKNAMGVLKYGALGTIR